MGGIQGFDWIFPSKASRLDSADSVVLQARFGDVAMRFGIPLAATFCLAAALAPAVCAAETGTAPVLTESVDAKRELASSFVAEKLATWQKRLHLEQWNVSVVMVRKTEMKQGTMGKIRWDKGKKVATIWTLDAADYAMTTDEMLKDLEFTIVHELIHLELASLPKSEASRRSEEFAVNQLAEALLALDRR